MIEVTAFMGPKRNDDRCPRKIQITTDDAVMSLSLDEAIDLVQKLQGVAQEELDKWNIYQDSKG